MNIESNFLKILDFIKNSDSLINCHLVDFFTKNLWDNCLPYDLKCHAEKVGSDVLREVEQFDISNLPNEESVLYSFLKDAALLKLENCDCIVTRSEFLNILCCKQERSTTKPFQTEHMKAKKCHEVDIFTKAIAWLIQRESSIVIDAGAGKGYTSLCLASHYDIPVVAVECSKITQKGALIHRQRVNKKNDNTKSLICYETEEINETTDFSKMVEKNFPDQYKEKKNLAIVALHGCGSLTDSVVKSFINNYDIKHLCIVPCCYHLSSKSLANIYEFSRNSRMLAQQSNERIKEKRNTLSPLLFYRAVLQVILQSLGIANYKVGRGAPVDNFLTYARWTLNKIDAKALSDEEIEDTYRRYDGYKWKFNFFQLLRIQLAPVIEAAILSDKFLFLKQSKVCKDLKIVQLFDPLVSPRSWAITAKK